MSALLQAARIAKRFGGLQALVEVSFSIERGEIYGLIGPNGAGKTTLFNCLTGLYLPEEGEFRFDGKPLSQLKPNEVAARGIARTFQSLRIFTNNLNVAMLACSNPSFEVNIAGGRIRNSDYDVLGPDIETFLSSYLFDFGIYGVAGVGEHGTLLDFYDEEVRARRLIHDNSRQTFLVLDHGKFGRSAHVRGGQIGEADKVFCNRRPPGQIVEVLENSGSQLVICGEDQSE